MADQGTSKEPAAGADGRGYIGSELELFAAATNWKAYFKAKIDPWIGGDVAEVGAGIGSNTALLMNSRVSSWLCLEPDARMAQTIEAKRASGALPAACAVRFGILGDLPERETFDTILYIDVLEHIEDDRAEVLAAARRLREGGRLIVLAPAHQALYTPFDKAIGHYRRYSISALRKLGVAPLMLRRSFYLDSFGSLASLANKLVLHSAHPNAAQIRFWDSTLVMLSRLADPLTFNRLGKTVIVVWTKQAVQGGPST